ncbi:MAG: bifunctional lytic transglycosylase/C40 family peptidase [Acidobacteriota bacterium]|nr:bifunctional lytic transglycosylase/C40 family peptidase [Acidobacteriota bacterium]
MTRAALIAASALLLLPALVLAAASGGLSVSTPSQAALAEIPPDYLLLYQEAGLGFDVPWQVLAGIGKVECNHGRNPDPACWQEGHTNSAGAGGTMQFLASTWQTYGLSASGNGAPDRWDPADAIVSAANFLKHNGAPDDIAAAVFAYNHSQAYVQQVLAWAGLYANAYSATAGAAAGAAAQVPSAAAQAAVAFALGQLGTPYRWGGEGAGGFDCSGLVQAAFAAAGIQLPRVAQAQYDATAVNTVPLEQLQPGDLVFFGSSPSEITHVGIVVDSSGDMVDAPHAGAVVRVEPYGWPDLIGGTRPVGARP